MFVTNIHLVLKRKVKESFWHVLSLSSLGFCELIWILALSTFKKKSIFFLLKFQLICSYVFNFVLILYMYVPLVWCVDFINLCVFLFSKRVTVFLIDFSLISFYIRPACPFSFAAFLFLGKLFLLSQIYCIKLCGQVLEENSNNISVILRQWGKQDCY